MKTARTPIARAGVMVAALITPLALDGCGDSEQNRDRTADPTPTIETTESTEVPEPTEMTVSGTVIVPIAEDGRKHGYDGMFCDPGGEFSDIEEGTRVAVTSGTSSAVIARGALDTGMSMKGRKCSFDFTVFNVPTERSNYAVKISDRRRVPFEEAKAQDISISWAAKPEPEPTKPAGLPTQVGGNGTYLVGTDMAPGIYHNGGAAPNDGRPCVAYVSRKPNDLSSYLRGSTVAGPSIVIVTAGEYFNTMHCQPWRRE